jgi:GR25 family glycosyltransferase involved in LPS biosynthesis
MVLGADSAYIINLEKHKTRRKRMDHLIQKLQLTNIKYIRGIDKQDFLEDSFVISKKVLDETFWDPNGWLTLGIIGCALSHKRAWKTFIDSGDEVGLFLEDDVRNTSYIHQLDFTKIREELDSIKENKGWGVAILGRYERDILRGEQITEHFYRSFPHKKQYSGHSYLLNRESAIWFYENTEKIKYAADIRIEISPFNVITLDQSILIQRHKDHESFGQNDWDVHSEKYTQLKEYGHTTTNECSTNKHQWIWKHEKVLISEHIPVVSYEKSKEDIRGRMVDGMRIKIGDTNRVFNKVFRR